MGPTVKLAVKDAVLLALLALEGQQPRERLASLLWPGAASVQAAGLNLRQRIFRLRQATGHPVVVAGAAMSLHSEGLDCDLWAAGWEARETWPEGELLAGVMPADLSEAMADWLAQARVRVTQVWQDSLWQAARKAELAGRHDLTLRLCRQWLRHQPWSEEQWRRLITAHYLAGDLEAAAQAAHEGQRALIDDLGITPSGETAELIDTVLYASRDQRRAARAQEHPLLTGAVRTPEAQAPDAARLSGQLQALSPPALLLARALALIDAHAPDLPRIATLARLLGVSPLELASPWQELEAAGLLQAGAHGSHIGGPALRRLLLAGIPVALQDHLRAQLT